MKPPSNKWPASAQGQGVLFFAQTMQALLADQTFEAFRAYALDSLARLREADSVSDDVRRARVKPAALKPVMEELYWSLGVDVGLQRIAGAEVELLRKDKEKLAADADGLQKLVRMMLRRSEESYRSVLRDMVVQFIDMPDRRSELFKTTALLVTHLINGGHSKRFLAARVEERFFASEQRRVGRATVRSFIDGIEAERRKYIVVSAVSGDTTRLLGAVGTIEVEPLSALPLHARKALKTLPDFDAKCFFAVQPVQAADAYRAVTDANNRLSNLRSFMIVPIKRMDVNWSSNFYVFKIRATTGQIIRHERSLALVQPPSTNLLGKRVRQIAQTPKHIDRNFDAESQERLISSLSTASVSIETNLPETRLISLWSAFEVLLSDPSPGEARIVHYVKNASPCIVSRYHRRLFAAVHEQLWASYHKKFQKLIERIDHPTPTEQVTRFIKLIVLPQYQAERDELLLVCNNSPLALHRLFRLHMHYGKPRALYETLRLHEHKVEWQLHRMYRARNNLVHAGRAPPFLESLTQNGLEYFRAAFLNIVRRSTYTPGPNHIDQLVAEIGFDWRMQQRQLATFPPQANFDIELVQSTFGPA